MPACTTRRRHRPHPLGRSLAVVAVAIGLLVAVSACSSDGSDGSAKEPSKKTTTTTVPGKRKPVDPDSIDGGQQAYVDALVPLITQSTGLSAGDATKAEECLAPLWVKIIGVKGFAAAGVRPEDLEDLDSGLAELNVDEATAKRLVAGFGTCKIDIRAAVLAAQAGDGMPEDVRACMADKLSAEDVEALLVAAITDTTPEASILADAQTCAPQTGG